MASEKKPSIYYDRGTIGSSDELDEYGVWVKGEPQDLSSVGAESQESANLSEPDLSDINDLPNFNVSGDDSSEESPEDTVSPDEDLELPDIDFDNGFEEDNISEGDDGSAGDDSSAGDDASEGEDEIVDFGESSADLELDLDSDESGDSAESVADDFELNEFPEPDFSDFTETEAEGGETLSGGEAEDLGFVEIAGEDAADEPVQALDDSEDAENLPLPPLPKETKPASQDLSTQLLMRIADELASIRTELSTLKSELAGIKAESASAETGDGQNHGFFDEEDDEKIALTGDELDNILNTADFTEEAGSDATEETGEDFGIQEAEDTSSGPFQEIAETPLEEEPQEEAGEVSFDDLTKDLDLDIGLEEKDLDELEGEISFDDKDQFDQQIDQTDEMDQTEEAVDEVPASQDAFPEEPVEFDITMNDGGEDLTAENPFEEILQEEDAPESLPDLEARDSEDLRRLREEGAQPMTPAPAPEDASFLEEDPQAFSEFEEESLDLSNAVIDEPDLSSEIQENPLEEPSLEDISIDLDLDEDLSLDEDIEEDTEDRNDGTGETEGPEEEIELPVSGESAEVESGDEIELGEEEEGGDLESASDLALIPEGFVVEAEDSGTPSIDSIDDDEGEEVFIEPPDEAGTEEAEEETLPPIQEIQEAKEIREDDEGIPSHLKQELKTVLSYMDQLLESLPDEKIEEFAKSEYFDTYKKLFKELGLV